MRVYISADMEGVSGVVEGSQVNSKEGREYERFQEVMTQEVNAAIRGVFAGGATEVLVNDSHADMRNILIEKLDSRSRLISGSAKKMSMMEGVKGAALALFIGYHAKAGSFGILNHTYSGKVKDFKINGVAYGETGVNALVAASFGVPVGLVTGDNIVCQEAKDILPGVETVVVKDAIGKQVGNLLHPSISYNLIETGAKKAVEKLINGELGLMMIENPVELELVFNQTGLAEKASVFPGSVLVDAYTVSWRSDNYLDVFFAGLSMLDMVH